MDAGKLQQLVANHNDKLEREALDEAQRIIERIAINQQRIQDLQQDIVELQKELKALSIQPLDPQVVLGEAGDPGR